MSKNGRNFRVSDSNLISHAEVVAISLPTDIGQMNGFDSTIDESYPQTITHAISEVKAIKTDQVIIDEMTELTQTVNDALDDCNTCYKTIAFFVRKAFADNVAVQNQMGLNDIAKVRNNVPKMVMFMNDVCKVVETYRDQLITAGCNPAVLDSIEQKGEALKESDTAQELFKKERGVITQTRVEKLNELYDLLKPISQIADIIYADDPAKMAVYTLPKPKSSTNSDTDLIVS